MPTYTFKNKDTGEVFDKVMKIAEKPEYLESNPNIEAVLTAPNFVGDHIIKKMDGGMKETFSRIAEAHPNSPLAQKYGKKGIKQIKTEQALAKNKRRLQGKK